MALLLLAPSVHAQLFTNLQAFGNRLAVGDPAGRATNSLDGPKGIATAEDAEIAVAHGVEVVYVSNHGGRDLDTAPATAEALPRVAENVAGRIPVLVDGGIRRGVVETAQRFVVACVAVAARARVVVGHDAGLMVNPAGVQHQIHGNVVQTTSRALKEQTRVEASGAVATGCTGWYRSSKKTATS